MSDRLKELEAFVCAASAGSFTSAAHELGLTSSGISKLIASLEARLKTRLLNRTTRKVRLTEEGAAYLEHARGILDRMALADEQVGAMSGAPRGIVRLSLPTGFTQPSLLDSVSQFLKRFPEIDLRLKITDDLVNLVEERIDVAIRVGHLADSGLIARKLGMVYSCICASPAYLAEMGNPSKPQELAAHQIISSRHSKITWRFIKNGAVTEVNLKPRVVTGDLDATTVLALSGAGIFSGEALMLEDRIKSGELVRVLRDFEFGEGRPIYAVMPAAAAGTLRVKALVDLFAANFARRSRQRIASMAAE